MPVSQKKIEDIIDKVALEVLTIEKGDVQALGNIRKSLKELENKPRIFDDSNFNDILDGLNLYIEKLILDETDDPAPLEEGIECLQGICHALSKNKIYKGDISLCLTNLGVDISGILKEEVKDTESAGEMDRDFIEQAMDTEDIDILNDFIVEATDNLASIEVSIIDLEQDPTDADTINSIFRPFHTIKGVSGFMNLTGINRLSHSAENLLVKAREGEIRVDSQIIDIILETVDMLKRMIDECRKKLEGASSTIAFPDITPLKNRLDEINRLKEAVADKPIGKLLVDKGAITQNELETGLEQQKETPEKRLGEILLKENITETKEIVSALRDQKKFGKKHIELQVKVDTQKLDNLVDLTGELVIIQAMLRQSQSILAGKDQKLFQNINQLNQITSSLQRTAMSMRMVPIKNTFQKMIRLVRDLSKNSHKEVDLTMAGEDTEIDRNVVEELYEPMVHMIRNSVDHGIESPEQRSEAGKREKGVISLKAYQRGGNIIIEISDDGRGLSKEKIIKKALANNLITDASKMTDSDIHNLIFHPGFSTAETVTDISGRGVGMDVVKKAIEKLRGRVEIISREGHGSTFIISLPLTLAIIEGMLVRVGSERYIIPALSILESFRPEKEQYATVEGKGEMILLRGNLIKMIRLSRLFGINEDTVNPWESLVVAVESEGEKCCLLIDELLGKEEVVIKSLGEGLKNTKGIAGGAIMGDGRVGLILDMAGILDVAKNS
ncbi:MAG: chemotaxis protein CheA [Desulfobacteraceae bacterium]|jgi:two-component system chemotaxis sensor kinase CheA